MKNTRRFILLIIAALIVTGAISGCSSRSAPLARAAVPDPDPTLAEADSSPAAATLDRDASDAPAALPAPVPGATPPISSGVAQTDLSGSTQLAAEGAPAMTANARQGGALLDEYRPRLAELRSEVEALRLRIGDQSADAGADSREKLDELEQQVSACAAAVENLKSAGADEMRELEPQLRNEFERARTLVRELRDQID